jgi:cell division initiation protein
MRRKKHEADQATEGPEAAPATEGAPVETTTRRKAAAPSSAGRITPLDIQQIEFRRSFKGYDEREVDEFLDRLTEDFANALNEVQRLRDRAEGGLGTVVAGEPDRAASKRQADSIVQKARDEAAGIVREAQQRASAIATGAGGISQADRAAISAFISKERDFLTSLASLVQGHAETVKGMAASARDRAVPPTRATPATKPTAASKPTTKAAVKPTGGPAQAPTASGSPPTPPSATKPMPKASTSPSPPPGTSAPGGPPVARSKGAEAGTPPGEGHVKVPEPKPAGVGKGDPELAEGDPSLRELFWGDE